MQTQPQRQQGDDATRRDGDAGGPKRSHPAHQQQRYDTADGGRRRGPEPGLPLSQASRAETCQFPVAHHEHHEQRTTPQREALRDATLRGGCQVIGDRDQGSDQCATIQCAAVPPARRSSQQHAAHEHGHRHHAPGRRGPDQSTHQRSGAHHQHRCAARQPPCDRPCASATGREARLATNADRRQGPTGRGAREQRQGRNQRRCPERGLRGRRDPPLHDQQVAQHRKARSQGQHRQSRTWLRPLQDRTQRCTDQDQRKAAPFREARNQADPQDQECDRGKHQPLEQAVRIAGSARREPVAGATQHHGNLDRHQAADPPGDPRSAQVQGRHRQGKGQSERGGEGELPGPPSHARDPFEAPPDRRCVDPVNVEPSGVRPRTGFDWTVEPPQVCLAPLQR